ncbi:MAG: NAD-dependent succinate-semialdehyde dehydrogenase [Cytophagaceae bacterium]|jgi:succinate-semialdehyde dehydrogenase/glutarate-semialdehyde dehydrogenase|nr:NAD-dependent succinate-semialdehyde dehydrogenase [Cytophagaceae bacterium]
MNIRGIESISPYSQLTHYQAVFFNGMQVEERLEKGQEASLKQLKISLDLRKALFLNLKLLLEKDKKNLAELIAIEMGKPIQEAVAEVEKCADLCGFYVLKSEKWLSSTSIEHSGTIEKRVEYLPLGLILGIMPWNFPFWQVFRFALPAIMAGNVVLLKHAPNVPLCALKIEELFTKAGFLEGIYQNLFIKEEQVEHILADQRVKAVSLTGSEKAGKSVAALAGKYLKKQVLELGGSDPFIVMPSADVALAAEWAVKARLICNGQSCIAAKRFIIHEKVYDEWLSLIKQQLELLKFGDPLDASVNIGPLARKDLADQLRAQVQEAVEAGARVEAEYFFETENANFVPVSVLVNIKKDNPIYHQELFGPVFLVYKVSNNEEALTLANDSPFGLGSSVWTSNEDEQLFFIHFLEAGSVFVNSMMASNAAMPFGGIKNSGYGRELAEEGLKEFCNVKAISINKLN